MNGDDKVTRIVLQPRDYRLLEQLAILRIVDREQASAVAPFSSKTRANARLLALTRAGVLRRVVLGTISGGRRAIYSRADRPSFTKRGQTAAGGTPVFGLLHQLAVNDVYVSALHGTESCVISWRTFDRPLDQTLSLIPDGYFEAKSQDRNDAFFVEVDRGTESLDRWRIKVGRYVALATSGLFEREFRLPRFGVVVVAPSERRLQGIRSAVAAETHKLFFFSTHSAIKRDGFWSSIWLRPRADEMEPLLRKEQPP